MIKLFKNLNKINMTTLKQNPVLFGSLLEDFFPSKPLYFPPVNIYENDRGFNIELNVPGIKKEEMSIQIEKGLLIISYEHSNNNEEKNEKFIKKEFSKKSFKRTFSLDDKINSQAIEATMENGILNIHLPLKEENVEPKKIISIK